MEVDTTFDFRTDARGKDPDTHSPTLRRYHQLLWSKPLPNGTPFDLSTTTPGAYLHHRSELGEFFLSSDTVMPTYTKWVRMASITEQMSAHEKEEFDSIVYTIGAMMVFPSNQVDRKFTINAARGILKQIADRMDLTLECIRRHYLGLESPLASTLMRYADFFALFGDFHGYVDFFVLNDLVENDSEVKFFMPFDDFLSPSVPTDLGTYVTFRQRSIDFIVARNLRISQLPI